MRLYIVLIIFAFLIAACENENGSYCDDCELYIWNKTSQRIVITQHGGLVPQSQTYDYVRDTLPEVAEQKLKQIKINNTELSCWNDGYMYKIVITNESGSESEYFGNKNACNDTEGKNFVDVQEIEDLLELL